MPADDGELVRQAAAFLEIPVNTVRSRLQSAKRQLRAEMRTMVSEVMNEGRPEPEFTRRVVDEALRHGREAYPVAAQARARWYLEHYGYGYRQGC